MFRSVAFIEPVVLLFMMPHLLFNMLYNAVAAILTCFLHNIIIITDSLFPGYHKIHVIYNFIKSATQGKQIKSLSLYRITDCDELKYCQKILPNVFMQHRQPIV